MPTVSTEDLIDTHAVAEIIGLAHRNAVSGYLLRYPDMPRPVIDLGPNRPRLWLKQDIEAWVQHRPAVRRGRPRKPSTPAAKTPAARSESAGPPGGAGRSGGDGPSRDGGRKSKGS